MINRNNSINPHKLYRDTEHGILGGVCAGVADYFGLSLTGLRFLTTIGFIINLPLLLFVYIILIFTLEKKPKHTFHSNDEETFWRGVKFSPKYTVGEMRHRFRKIDDKIKHMESYVTSKEYQLRKEYQNL